MRLRINFLSALLTAAVIHTLFVSFFLFTFPNPKVSAKPMFIFLGSFLGSQDVVLTTGENFYQQGKMSSHALNLDIRQNLLPHELNKPSLINRVDRPAKRQYMPVMKKDAGFIKSQNDLSDLGIDLTPFTPVRMKIDRNDQN